MAAPAVTELNGILAAVPITGEYNLQVHMAGFRLDFSDFSPEVKGFFPTLLHTASAFSVTGNASLGVSLLEICWLICSQVSVAGQVGCAQTVQGRLQIASGEAPTVLLLWHYIAFSNKLP